MHLIDVSYFDSGVGRLVLRVVDRLVSDHSEADVKRIYLDISETGEEPSETWYHTLPNGLASSSHFKPYKVIAPNREAQHK